MAGPHITLILASMLSGRLTGMLPDGMRGIKQILPTGNIFITSIPIGAPTKLAAIMTRLFITATIMAKAGAGIADYRANHNRT
ncbi:MAG: hypothetical protein A2139_13135 [Desulfobacca sp. RBG_16_60_12]|nr:MAG: hypothetical protein A2139_13135 [Desulfobacca sp. RBG_16_60_12]